MRSIFLYIPICLFLFSCRYLQHKNDHQGEDPLARVGENYLYFSDIQNLVRGANSAKDSTEIIQGYIEDWIKQKLMLKKALTYIPPEKLEIDKQVNDYRESLILYLYEKELILQKLDTAVKKNEVKEYYEQYKDNFELEDDVTQFYYIKVANNAPKLDSLQMWIRSDKEEDKIKLTDYCYQYAEDFYLSDSAWYKTDLLFEYIPIHESHFATLQQYKTSAMVQDSLYTYILKVNDSKEKGELAPFNYVMRDITKIILNKRKMDLVNSMYENIYKEALSKSDFEIYR